MLRICVQLYMYFVAIYMNPIDFFQFLDCQDTALGKMLILDLSLLPFEADFCSFTYYAVDGDTICSNSKTSFSTTTKHQIV